MPRRKKRSKASDGDSGQTTDSKPASNNAPTSSVEDDTALFRAATANVKPLIHDGVTPSPRPPPPRPKPRLEENAGEDSGGINEDDILVYRRPGVPMRTFNRLRRGQFAVDAELDLHGLTARAAERTLRRRIDQCLEDNGRCLCVIHGKGFLSKDGEPVLKRRIGAWLIRHPGVLAFTPAQARHGGGGALYVLLKLSP